jgi:hypothetical protein
MLRRIQIRRVGTTWPEVPLLMIACNLSLRLGSLIRIGISRLRGMKTFDLVGLRDGISRLELDSGISSVLDGETYGAGNDDASEAPVPR